jgi:hypothetical protein
MAVLPIYFGDREVSLKAAMIFREPRKAEALAGWLILRVIRDLHDKGLHGWIKNSVSKTASMITSSRFGWLPPILLT